MGGVISQVAATPRGQIRAIPGVDGYLDCASRSIMLLNSGEELGVLKSLQQPRRHFRSNCHNDLFQVDCDCARRYLVYQNSMLSTSRLLLLCSRKIIILIM